MMLGAGFRPTPANDTITLRDGHSRHLARRPARYAIWGSVAGNVMGEFDLLGAWIFLFGHVADRAGRRPAFTI
jgi:hypothetical protein